MALVKGLSCGNQEPRCYGAPCPREGAFTSRVARTRMASRSRQCQGAWSWNKLPTAVFASLAFCVMSGDVDTQMELYAPKSCKYILIPDTLDSRSWTTSTKEVFVSDVFGVPAMIKRHVIKASVPTSAFVTIQAEVHRDTPATFSIDVFRRGQAVGGPLGKPGGRILTGRKLLGSGGDDAKVFLHGQLSDRDLEVDIVFEISSVEVAKAQVDYAVNEAHCWPLRLDIAIVPVGRADLHWPQSCPSKSFLPEPWIATDSELTVLGDEKMTLPPFQANGKHFSERISNEAVDGPAFGTSIWNGIIEVPPRLHRFVRFFFRTSFHFASAPLQLVLELFELKDMPDGTALAPTCKMGCLGGVPVYNGQLIDHAMPTGFRYRIWLLKAVMPEWIGAIPDKTRHCVEFDFDYSVGFEQGMTPFEVGPAAWLCASTRLPSKIVQTSETSAWKDHVDGQLVVGRSVWVRDRFGFPPDEVSDMEHKVKLEVSEASIFRASTHHSDGVDVFIALSKRDSTGRICRTVKHPGPVPRQSIFCYLEPGSYDLTFFADYPLGGLHPCGEFFAQIGVRPVSINSAEQTRSCIAGQSDMKQLVVPAVYQSALVPAWKAIKVPIQFDNSASPVVIWRNVMTVEEEDAPKKPFLRLVVNSDYISSDLRFQVKFGSKYVADTQVTAHGYADMIGPLDQGEYTMEMYYISGTNAPKAETPSERFRLCSSSMVDARIISKSDHEVGDSNTWLCTSVRVPPPDTLAPQSDEQVLIDSEFMIPTNNEYKVSLNFADRRLVRIVALSTTATFEITLHAIDDRAGEKLVEGIDNIQIALEPGKYSATMKANAKSGSSGVSSCPTFVLNMLLQPEHTMVQCPWSPNANTADQSDDDRAQREASDHIGNLKLDLTPQPISKEWKKMAPVSMWMNQAMEKSFEMNLDTASALRVEVALSPPFLPIELVLRRVRANGKLKEVVAVGEWTETRLLLMNSDVPKGKYEVEFLQSEKYTVKQGRNADEINNLCAHVTIFAEVGVSSKEAINTLRSELLDVPELLAVQPFPPSINMVGWLGNRQASVAGTQVYRFPDGEGKSSLVLTDKALIRIVTEPADLSNSAIDAKLTSSDGNSVASSDNLGQLVAVVQPGTYELHLVPHNKASPFLVTFGLATEQRLRQDLVFQESSFSCLSAFPKLLPPTGFSAKGWSIGPTLVRLGQSFLSTEMLARIPITIRSLSVVHIEVGSGLPLDLVRIAIQVPEGLWIGEQRGTRNGLSIELSDGTYMVHIAQPKPTPSGFFKTDRCLDFTVFMTATPINPDSATDAAAESAAAAAASGVANPSEGGVTEVDSRDEEVLDTAACFSMGTVPLPLDLSDPTGGSQAIGGPMDKDGRLLLRARVMITDMHDGRKKVFVNTEGKMLQLKVGVSMGGFSSMSRASQLSFGVMESKTKSTLEPVEVYNTKDGWERIYKLTGESYWLVFHHPHRERSATACIHFGLQIETHPLEDMQRMLECDKTTKDADTYLPEELDIRHSQEQSRLFRKSIPNALLRQGPTGFLDKMAFKLTQTSWISIDIGYNFFTSHGEMDIGRKTSTGKLVSVVEPVFDFFHEAGHRINARLVASGTLPAGDYLLRVADDHYMGQSTSSACYPWTFNIVIVPKEAFPSVVSLLPHPSVPIPRGMDLVVTLRFSVPPYGTAEEVISKISLGGVQAHLSGSASARTISNQFDVKRTNVQASSSEGHLVWVITFLADAIADMKSARLELGDLVSNRTRQKYSFHAPRYTFGLPQTPLPPWSGGGEFGGTDNPENNPDAYVASGAPTESAGNQESQAVGFPKSEGSSASAFQASSGSGDLDGMMPRVEEWRPPAPVPQIPSNPSSRRSDSSESSESAPSDAGCPEGTTLNVASGVCEIGNEWPVGYRVVVFVLGGLALFVLYHWGAPKIRMMNQISKDKSTRFRDIGERSSEEELGLVQAMDYDEDML